MEIKLNPEMRVLTFKLDEELLQELDLYVIKSGLTRSQVIREALESYDWDKKKIMPIRIRTITVKLEGELLQKLELYAVNARVTKSQVIREALKIYLAKVRGYEDTD